MNKKFKKEIEDALEKQLKIAETRTKAGWCRDHERGVVELVNIIKGILNKGKTNAEC